MSKYEVVLNDGSKHVNVTAAINSIVDDVMSTVMIRHGFSKLDNNQKIRYTLFSAVGRHLLETPYVLKQNEGEL